MCLRSKWDSTVVDGRRRDAMLFYVMDGVKYAAIKCPGFKESGSNRNIQCQLENEVPMDINSLQWKKPSFFFGQNESEFSVQVLLVAFMNTNI